MSEYKIGDIRAIEVVIEHEGGKVEVIGFACELRGERWAAINAALPDPIVGVYRNARKAYDAIVDSEEKRL